MTALAVMLWVEYCDNSLRSTESGSYPAQRAVIVTTHDEENVLNDSAYNNNSSNRSRYSI